MHSDKFGFSGKPSTKRCPDCKGKLGPLEYGRKWDKNWKLISPVDKSDTFWRACQCGCYITWSWPNVWKRHHIMPLLNMKQMQDILMEV